MKLPQFQTEIPELTLMQNKWASLIEPGLSLPQTQAVILKNVVLSSSSVIDHTLGRNLQGWQVIRQRGNAQIFDTQDVNPIPDKTLQLKASSGVSVDLIVF